MILDLKEDTIAILLNSIIWGFYTLSIINTLTDIGNLILLGLAIATGVYTLGWAYSRHHLMKKKLKDERQREDEVTK